jgi:HEAT repeat protein
VQKCPTKKQAKLEKMPHKKTGKIRKKCPTKTKTIRKNAAFAFKQCGSETLTEALFEYSVYHMPYTSSHALQMR